MTGKTASKRVIWTKVENHQVAAAVYRQFKHEAAPGKAAPPSVRFVLKEDVEKAQSIAIHDRARHKPEISLLVTETIGALVREIAYANPEPERPPQMAEAREVIGKAATTIDLQIRSLVRSELVSQQSALLGKIESLLHSHERTIAGMLDQHEQRLIQFWSGPKTAEVVVEEVGTTVRTRKLRVLVACLRRDQHHLVHDRLEHATNHVDVVILDQEDGFVGIKKEYYDKVLVLSKFVGHSHFAKVQSLFSKDQIVLRNGAALTAATTILAMLPESTAC
jgi:hypothetical protein